MPQFGIPEAFEWPLFLLLILSIKPPYSVNVNTGFTQTFWNEIPRLSIYLKFYKYQVQKFNIYLYTIWEKPTVVKNIRPLLMGL